MPRRQEYIDSQLKTPLGPAKYSLVNTKMLSHYLLVNWINETRYSVEGRDSRPTTRGISVGRGKRKVRRDGSPSARVTTAKDEDRE